MNYVCYELDEDPEGSMNWYERIAFRISEKMASKVNPDFYKKYKNVVYWWLELDQENLPVREIGFDKDGIAIVVGPFGNNRGLFTYKQQKVLGFYPIEMFQFIDQWESFEKYFSENANT